MIKAGRVSRALESHQPDGQFVRWQRLHGERALARPRRCIGLLPLAPLVAVALSTGSLIRFQPDLSDALGQLAQLAAPSWSSWAAARGSAGDVHAVAMNAGGATALPGRAPAEAPAAAEAEEVSEVRPARPAATVVSELLPAVLEAPDEPASVLIEPVPAASPPQPALAGPLTATAAPASPTAGGSEAVAPARPLATATVRPAPAAERAPSARPAQTHVVAKGETLWAIASRYDTTVGALAAHNKLDNPNAIAEGERLALPR